jgi:RES domain-containing protein
MLDDLKVVREAFPRTIRLVSSARLRPPVLAALVPPGDLAALAEIEGATSQRLLSQARGADGIDRDEFVYGVPHAAFINASFAYSKPSEPNRFNASRGAWYAALDVTTCMAEVAYHMADFLGKSGLYKGVVDYAELFASMAGEFVDLRQMDSHPCLNPDPAIGYPIGNALADAARAQGLNGVIYPSVRHPAGTCIVALWPHAVQSVAQGAIYRFEWSGGPEPAITRLSE